MKKFLERAFQFTVIICMGSLFVDIVCAYHILTDVKTNPVYSRLLMLNMKTVLVAILVFVAGSLLSAWPRQKTPKKRKGFSGRVVNRH